MTRVGQTATSALAGILKDPLGLPSAVGEMAELQQIELAPVANEQIVAQNVGADAAERAGSVKYPLFYVYCERLSNQLTEKFRSFSGKAHMVLDVRVSHDHIEGMEAMLQAYVDAATTLLDASRGQWAGGLYYAGGYEVTFGGIKRGGKNFLQSARVSIQLDVSLR